MPMVSSDALLNSASASEDMEDIEIETVGEATLRDPVLVGGYQALVMLGNLLSSI